MKDFAKSIVCNAKTEIAETESAVVGNYDPNDYKDDPRHKWTVKSIENEIQKYKQRIELNRVRMTQLRNMENSGNYPSSSRELKEEQKDYEANQMKIKQLVSMLRRATGNSMEEVGNANVGNANTHLTASNSGELWLNYDGTGEMYDPIELGRYDFSGKSEAMSVVRDLEQLKRKVEQKVKDTDKFISAIKQWASGLK